MSTEFIERIFVAVAKDENLKNTLINQPADALRQYGFWIPPQSEQEFLSFFSLEVAPLFNSFISDQTISFISFAGAECAVCKVSAWLVAATIVGLGAATVGALSAASPAIIGLASFMNVLPTTALAFLGGLSGYILGDIARLVNAICIRMGVCP